MIASVYYLGRIYKLQAQGEGNQPAQSSLWIEETEDLGRPKQLEFAGQNIRAERAAKRRSSWNLQRFPPESSTECWSEHKCKQTTFWLGNELLERSRGTIFSNHIKLGMVHTSKNLRWETSWCIGHTSSIILRGYCLTYRDKSVLDSRLL